MAYNEQTAKRIREILVESGALGERKMFGGIAFMLGGHMICGVLGDDLMLRVGRDALADALDRPHTRVMDFTGRPSPQMIYVEPAGFKTSKALGAWLTLGIKFVRVLPPRTSPKPRRPTRKT
jgi:hypothetical protein